MRVEGNLSRHRAVVTPGYALDNTGRLDLERRDAARLLERRRRLRRRLPLMRARGGICTCLRISTPEEFDRSIERGSPVDADAYRADFEIERAKQEIWHHMVFRARARQARPCGRAAPALLVSVQRPQGVRPRPQERRGSAVHLRARHPRRLELRFEHARVSCASGRWSARSARSSATRPTSSGLRRR
jgi:hypothetical protein